MLGEFLEISVSVAAPGDTLEQLAPLGFVELETIELDGAPVAVVWDGRVALGLYAGDAGAPTLTFVRRDLESYLYAFRRGGFELAFTQLAEDEFHQAGLDDPNGQRIVLNEARTFSPAVWQPGTVPACGELVEYSIATGALDDSIAFWERIGLAVAARGETPHRWARVTGNGLTLGLHERARFEPGLTFRAASFDARCEYLRALGRTLTPGAPVAVDTGQAATLATAMPLAFYLVGDVEA